jgi:hypothetical protein
MKRPLSGFINLLHRSVESTGVRPTFGPGYF